MLEVADILRRYGGVYLDRFGDAVPQRHRRAIQDILDCRTAAMGGQVYACNRCGRAHYSYHSCRNRSCPKCQGRDVEAWLDARRAELLPVPYFHVVFTLPQALRRIVRSHPKPLYGILMKAAAKALMKLAADPRYVGGQIGILAILHTWTRTLEYHPHVHCLVPGGGLSPDGRWVPSKPDYFVPVKALSAIFRGIFVDLVRRACPDIILPQSIWDQKWVVYAKPTVQGVDRVFMYLGRYVHRAAITNSRIVSIDDGRVVLRYRGVGDSKWKTMALETHEFIRRFLQHVLPSGVHKVRYYGLWAPSNRKRLRRIQDELAKDEPGPAEQDTPEPSEPTRNAQPLGGQTCPRCGEGTLVWLADLPRPARGPPRLILAPSPDVARFR